MFTKYSPVVCSVLRGIVVGLLVGLLNFGILYGVGASQRTMVATLIGIVVPIWLGFLGYGVADQNRANSGNVQPSDVVANTPVAKGAKKDGLSIDATGQVMHDREAYGLYVRPEYDTPAPSTAETPLVPATGTEIANEEDVNR